MTGPSCAQNRPEDKFGNAYLFIYGAFFMAVDKDQLFSQSVIVTGTHYSMSSLTGQILGEAPEFNVVTEPLNASPTLSYTAIGAPYWYSYYDDSQYKELRTALMDCMLGQGVVGESISRVGRVRSFKDVLRIGKYAAANMKRLVRPKRAVFKDPFLAFSGRTLQERDGLSIILCLRHPCAFAESMKRRGDGFEFSNLADQPSLMAALPKEDTKQILEFVEKRRPVIEQAALLWKIVYRFAESHYLDHPKTYLIRQEDLANGPVKEVDRLFNALNATRTPNVDAFLKASLNAKTPVDFNSGTSSYVHRNAKATAKKWKKRLASKEISRIFDIAGETAARYGYQPDT